MESTTTPKAAATKPAAPEFSADRMAAQLAERERELSTALRFADAHSSRNFGAIEALARVTLLSLETPDGHTNSEDVANVLRTVMNLAADAASEINAQAANADCGYVDHEAFRRIKALWKADQQAGRA